MIDFAAHTARIINRLGQPVTLTPVSGPARVVNAVFTARPDVVFSAVSGNAPQLRLASADATGLAVGDAVTIGSTAYTLATAADDSQDSGDVVYTLEAA